MTSAADRIRGVAGEEPIATALVLGTGLGVVTERFENAHRIAFADLEGFPADAVSGHAKRVVVGSFAGKRVVALEGRAHPYESGDAAAMRPAFATLKALGVRRVVLTNAAGSLDPETPPGALVAISDHINLTGLNPLVGLAGDERFVDMVDAYAPPLRIALAAAAAAEGVPLGEGVYMFFPGPSFETPAEIRAAKVLGADLVGMSLAPEAVLARHFGFELAAISVVTNFAAGLAAQGPSHAETKTAAAGGAEALTRLLARFVEGLDGL